MKELLNKAFQIFSDHRNQKSSWSRWAGSFIIAVVLFNWTYITVKKEIWTEMDLNTVAVMIFIFLTLSVKSILETAVPDKTIPQPPLTENDQIVEELVDLGADAVLISKIKTKLNSVAITPINSPGQ